MLQATGSSADVQAGVRYIMGIDEAGRGPVLGPMVYGACYCPLTDKDPLKKMGFADSKALTEAQRDKLFEKISNSSAHQIRWDTIVLSPEELSHSMLRLSKYNLNAISHDTAIALIRHVLERGVTLHEVYIDTVGDPDKYMARLTSLFPTIPTIIVSKKADSIYPIVSAASICAKVIRDNRLKHWEFAEKDIKITSAFGSGYPGDPLTKKWLKDCMDHVFGFPSVMRFSWKTCTNLLYAAAVPVAWRGGDGDEGEPVDWKARRGGRGGKSPSPARAKPAHTSSPYVLKSKAHASAARYRYFADNNISSVKDFD